MSTRTTCRACECADLERILYFGESPLADQLLSEDQLDQTDRAYPLDLVFCPTCALVQITEDVPPDILYGGDYPYYTSVSPGLVKHFTASAEAMMERQPLGADSLVIEAASNDGYMLKVFAAKGIPVLGIDPASGPAEVANKEGVETLVRFFDAKVARELVAEGRRADLLIGNNVLNLIQDLPDFMEAVDLLLVPDGLCVLEIPYLVDTVDQTAFDNVFHQNTTYWSATSVRALFQRHGFEFVDVERIPTFGGSLRATFQRGGTPSAAAREMLAEEERRGVGAFPFYSEFAGRVASIKEGLIEQARAIRARGERIVAYGAAGGMATTLLAYVGFDRDTIDYAVDINHHKHGRYTAGSRLLVHPAEKLVEDKPEYALLLAWNFAREVMEQQKAYVDGGGRFLVPIPEPHVLGG